MHRTSVIARTGILVVGLVLTATASMPAAASAATALSPYDRLQSDAYTLDTDAGGYGYSECSTVGWRYHGSDSPADSNSGALVSKVCGEGGGELIEVVSDHSLHLNRPAGSMTNLSYDFHRKAVNAGGGLYILLIVANTGDDQSYVRLHASDCADPYAGTGWVRADFTGHLGDGDCSLQSSTSTGTATTVYTNTPTTSAWDAYVAAHPDAVVQFSELLMDNLTGSTLTQRVDRLSLGSGWMYDRSAYTGVYCGYGEARC